ncbi:hypothetical protein QYF61_002473 [Mycteria americana]|uniref:Uncharacterized protein n=1 Tax=Mycteria americana TaxID=33587 RepID=A0AAN7PPC9_MYCAM|nr:hypothetical protein QYF61_002473 [Mycteria americana]
MSGHWVQSGSSSRADSDRLEMLEPRLCGFYYQAIYFDSYLNWMYFIHTFSTIKSAVLMAIAFDLVVMTCSPQGIHPS